MRIGIGLVTLAFVTTTSTCQTSVPEPLVAIGSGNSVVLLSKTGETISTVRLPIEVGQFSFSPDLKRLVIVSSHPDDESGGKMYVYSLAAKHLQRIPARAVLPEAAKSEVYSDPQFSPDGTKLFFLVHPQAEGDLGDTSGPIAELDFKTLRTRELQSNAGNDTDGARLSPNGREILLWDPGMVIDTKGSTLYDIHGFQLDEPFRWALDLAWIGNSRVLYQAGKSADSSVKGEVSYFVLDLKSLKSTRVSETLGLSDNDLDGLVAYRYPYAVVKSKSDSASNTRSEYFLISPGRTRTKLTSGNAAAVQILSNNITDRDP